MPIYIRVFSWLSLSLGLLLSSNSPKAESASISSRLDPLEKHWVLRTLDGAAVPASLKVDNATVHLMRSTSGSARRQTTGYGYAGVFTHTLGSRLLALAQVIATLMKCDDTTMNVELRYLTVLEQATYYKLDGTRLSLFNKQGEAPRATFEAVE